MCKSGLRLMIWIYFFNLVYYYTAVRGQGEGQITDWACVSPVREVYKRENMDALFQFDVSGHLPQQVGEIETFTISFYDGTVLGSVVYLYPFKNVLDPAAGVTLSADNMGRINVTLANVNGRNRGTYRISGRQGTIACCCLYILGSPTKPVISVTGSPAVGGSATFSCTSSSTTLPSNHSLSLVYSWKDSNTDNPTGPRYSYSGNKNMLKLSNIEKEDASKQFTCSATEHVSGGYTSRQSDTVYLDVRYPPDGPPVIAGYINGSEYRVIEGTQGHLTCSVSDGNPKPTLTWYCINGGSQPTTTSGTVTRVHTWMALRGQDKNCICRSSHYSGDSAVSIRINVLYPPAKPVLQIKSTTVSGTVKVIRNNSLSVNCSSSGQPEPSYTWIYANRATSNRRLLSVGSIQNDGRYICEVKNTMNPSESAPITRSNMSFIDVSILFPPSLPTFYYWDTSGPSIPTTSLDVIKGDTFSVACSSVGQPTPVYHWDNFGTNRILTVTSITADRSDVCTARNTMSETVGETRHGSASATMNINVQYPPVSFTMKYHHGQSSETIITRSLSIIEGNPFTVICNNDGNPSPSYRWTGTVSSSSATLHLNNTRRSQTGTLTCMVENVMTRTFPNPEKEKLGRINGSVHLNILYPPIIRELQNIGVVEGSPLTVSCPETVGNPPETTFEWTRNGSLWRRAQEFTIDRTYRTDAMIYTCKVSNIMQQTGGQPVSQPDTKTFYLTVWYSAHVTEFYISGHKGETNVTVNENDTLQFKCKADSNPGSTLSIVYKKDVKNFRTHSTSIDFNTGSVKCTDRGVYSCESFNQYNTGYSGKSLNLFINCRPRPSPYSTLKENVTSAQHQDASLTFTALAYPVPEIKDYMWFKWNESAWLHIADSEQFKIVTSHLQTNLTVMSVNRSYFGMYKLVVVNDFGRHEQIFNLLPEDIPEQPTQFRHIVESVTKSSITVEWMPGFNNGLDQTFLLKYKKMSDKEWTTALILDTKELTMNYTIHGLTSGTHYFVVMYAINKLGKSTETEVLKIATKDTLSRESTDVIGGVAGGVSAVVVIIIAVVIVVILKRRNLCAKENRVTMRLCFGGRKGKETDNMELEMNCCDNSRDMYEQLHQRTSRQDRNVYDSLEVNAQHYLKEKPAYENLQQAVGASPHHSKPSAASARNDTDPTYENLKL